MDAHDPVSFATVLRRCRGAAGLTQEELAARANLSARAVSDLERGSNRLPRPTTVHLLATALGLSAEERAAFIAAARRDPSAGPSAASAPGQGGIVLPVWLTPLIGRERDQADVVALLRRPGVRLLTLTGPGGVGKTRLAVQVATAVRDDFADEVVWVDLSPLRDPALVVPALVRALGVRERERDAKPLHERLADYLRAKHLLLLLDNCEQVSEAWEALLALLATCPRLVVLATSRVALRVRGEHVYRLAPLALPETVASPEAVACAAAVALFVERARATGADLPVTAATAPVIVEICRRLDGLPLAIELAAAWAPLLPPAALLAELERRLVLLVSGPADLPPRQHTLRDAIAWSYDLLDAREQALFRQLSVFEGGCTLAAAAAVCGDEHADGTGEIMVAPAQPGNGVREALLSLIAQNLVVRSVVVAEGAPRFRMLETIREYARDRLVASGELAATQERHGLFFLALAVAEAPVWPGVPPWPWLERLEREHENLRATREWSMTARRDMDAELRLVGALLWFWYIGGHYSEGRLWSAHALASTDATRRSLPRARALLGLGMFAALQGDSAAAGPSLAESMAIYRGSGDERGAGYALVILGMATMGQGEIVRAVAPIQESIAVFHAVGDRWGEAYALYGLGNAMLMAGRMSEARVHYDASLALWEALGDTWGRALLRGALGNVALAEGDDAAAEALLSESVALFRAHAVKWELAQTLNVMGAAVVRRGDVVQAEHVYLESLRIWHAIGNEMGLIMTLAGIAVVAALRGLVDRAARLFGAVDALSTGRDRFAYAENSAIFDRYIGEARTHLDNATFAAGWAEGQALTLEQAVAYALDETKA